MSKNYPRSVYPLHIRDEIELRRRETNFRQTQANLNAVHKAIDDAARKDRAGMFAFLIGAFIFTTVLITAPAWMGWVVNELGITPPNQTTPTDNEHGAPSCGTGAARKYCTNNDNVTPESQP